MTIVPFHDPKVQEAITATGKAEVAKVRLPPSFMHIKKTDRAGYVAPLQTSAVSYYHKEDAAAHCGPSLELDELSPREPVGLRIGQWYACNKRVAIRFIRPRARFSWMSRLEQAGTMAVENGKRLACALIPEGLIEIRSYNDHNNPNEHAPQWYVMVLTGEHLSPSAWKKLLMKYKLYK